MFSIHDKNIPVVPKKLRTPVYAGILDTRYEKDLPKKLKENGFAGLTINENNWKDQEFTTEVPEIKDFSIRINRKGKCDNETMILPDLRVINTFDEFMQKD
jgi:hypothetical protein